MVKDIARVEALLADGYADEGKVIVLSNDRSYWHPPARADTIDAQFRIHDGRVLTGMLAWDTRAGRGTTIRRDTPLVLAGRHTCHWNEYARITLAGGRHSDFRYLLISAQPGGEAPPSSGPGVGRADRGEAAPVVRSSPRVPSPYSTARSEILATARKLAAQSPDGSFTLQQILTEMRRAGTRYTESTIRTHVTSRMCADAPVHHDTTYNDFQRLGGGRYRMWVGTS